MVVVRTARTDKAARLSTALTAFEDGGRLMLGHIYWTLNVRLLHSQAGLLRRITCAVLGRRVTRHVCSPKLLSMWFYKARTTDADASWGSEQRLLDWW